MTRAFAYMEPLALSGRLSFVSAKIIQLPDRKPRASGVPDDEQGFLELRGDELAIFVLRESGETSSWVRQDARTTAKHWRYIIDFLEQIDAGLSRLCDKQRDRQ